MNRKKDVILRATVALTENYKKEELFMPKNNRELPSRAAVIDVVKELRSVIFPGYFWNDSAAKVFPEYFAGYRLNDLYDRLKEQIEIALLYAQPELEQEGAEEEADRICAGFFEQLPEVQQRLLKDVQAGFDGDPAAKSKEEIISSYPGLFAIYVYRLAHLLYKEEVPYIPRIMTEYAHGKTGIDINPGATIGDYFFIDHGTGVVIGETTEIGCNVKLYQGVTLGALSTRQGQQLANVKRHADLEDLGFLEQPHTSAGRIPSAKGYRFYVDAMLHSNGTEREDAEKINKIWQEKPANFEDFFLNVAKLISQISHNMSLFLAPAHDTSVLKFIHVLPIGENRAIMVVVTDQGALDNEPMYFKEAVADDVLASMAIRMTNALKDVRLSSMTLQNLEATVQLIEGPRAVLLILAEALYRAIAKRKLFYSVGTTELLEQPEFKDIKKVQPILSMLEEQDQLNQLLAASKKNGIGITIGSENQAEPLKDLSVIQADFGDKDERIGTLAILGPTRMEYGRIIGILSYMQDFMRALAENKNRK